MARKLVIVILLAAFAWSGYWWLGSTTKEAALKGWLAERQGAGWVADYENLQVRGFPNRFDTRIINLELADPQSGWAWSAPEFQVLALSYQPNHIIAIWPRQQTISSPFERILVQSRNMRASVVFEADTALAINRVVLEVDEMALTSTADWDSSLQQVKLSTRQTLGEPFAHDLDFQARNLKPARVFKAIIDPGKLLPEAFEKLTIQLTGVFDGPWDRHAAEGDKPQLTRLDIDEITATWGRLDFQAKGSVTVDGAGYPVGKISVRARNWRDMLAVGVSSGLLPQEIASTLEGVLSIVANLSGNPQTLDAPLSFANGQMKLGPVSLGPAPRLRFN